MGEYNMTHTGAQLDDAINKVNSGYILPSGSKSITSNGTFDVKAFANAVANVQDSEHYSFGYKTFSANASFSVNGITDMQGNAFTPNGYAFILAPNVSSNTNYTNSTNSLVCCFYDISNNIMLRNILYTPAYTIRCNPSVSSGSVGNGWFEQAASSSKSYNIMGQRYFWVAWG